MIDPRYQTVKTWTDSTALDLSGLLTVPRLTNPDSWKDWAAAVAFSPELAPYCPPDPRSFTHWRDWAMRFVQAVPL